VQQGCVLAAIGIAGVISEGKVFRFCIELNKNGIRRAFQGIFIPKSAPVLASLKNI
jgi:hypothetical protein